LCVREPRLLPTVPWERLRLGESADSVWKALSTEHQKLFHATSRSNEDIPLLEAPATLPGAQPGPAAVVQEAIAESSVLMFGQQPASLSGRRPRRYQPRPAFFYLLGITFQVNKEESSMSETSTLIL